MTIHEKLYAFLRFSAVLSEFGAGGPLGGRRGSNIVSQIEKPAHTPVSLVCGSAGAHTCRPRGRKSPSAYLSA
eukprot:364077-Chlamydomonas_euryale.AAC.3